MTKKYLEKNVFEAAVERINFIFDNFNKIYVSFSSGKDSGVLLNLCIDEARKRNKKIGCLFIDLEAYYSYNIDFVNRMIKNNIDVLEPMWICLPMRSENSLSYFEPIWSWWDEDKKDIWIREMPNNKYVINLNNHKFDFYNQNITFEKFISKFGNWYSDGEPTACLVGIRTDESLRRYCAINTETKPTFKNKNYSTQQNKNVYNFYPIYDCSVSDIWIYNSKFKKDYNEIYNLFYKAGIPINKMRVDEPFGNEAKAGLNLFRVIEPKTWMRVVGRVRGANFGNIYSGTKIMTHKYTLPKNHTWKSFTKFLLKVLPENISNNYKTKFIKFIKYWNKKGCGIDDDIIEKIINIDHKSIIKTEKLSSNTKIPKKIIKFKKIVDELPNIESKDDFCTWKRLALCIIKNDYLCKSLSFGYSKEFQLRKKEIIEKYKKI